VWHKERLGMACTGKRWNLVRHHVRSEPGDLSTDARSFAGEDRSFLFGHAFLGIRLSGRANACYLIDFQGEIRGVVTHDDLLRFPFCFADFSHLWESDIDPAQSEAKRSETSAGMFTGTVNGRILGHESSLRTCYNFTHKEDLGSSYRFV